MKWLYSAGLLAVFCSCKKDASDHDKIIGRWNWKESVSFYYENGIYNPASPQWGTARPLDNTNNLFTFNSDGTFSRDNFALFYQPVALSGTYEVRSLPGEYFKQLILSGPDDRDTFRLQMKDDKIVVLEAFENSRQEHEFQRK